MLPWRRLRAQGCFTSRGTPPRLFAPRTRCPLTRHAATVGRDGFTYLSPEAAERIERELEEARQLGLQEYQELKDLLLKRTWRFGTLFALYLLLAASAEVCAWERREGGGREEGVALRAGVCGQEFFLSALLNLVCKQICRGTVDGGCKDIMPCHLA